MRTQLLLLPLLFLSGACQQSPQASAADLEHLESGTSPVELVSAMRFAGGWNPQRRDENGELVAEEWFIRSAWEASPATLDLLGEALLNRPWCSTTEYALDGGRSRIRRSSQGRTWIDCTFSTGTQIRLFHSSLSQADFTDGWHGPRGEVGYRLSITHDEYRETLSPSGWVELERDLVVDVPPPENDVLLSRLHAHPEMALDSPLSLDPALGSPTLLGAIRVTTSGASDQGPHGTLEAQGQVLELLEEALLGHRWAVLRFSLDGTVSPMAWDETPSERITCMLSHGESVELHIFPADGAWHVVGEGPFRLAISSEDAGHILDPGGWQAAD